MKTNLGLPAYCLVAAGFMYANHAAAQEKKEAQPGAAQPQNKEKVVDPAKMDMDAMMKEYMKTMGPGPQHKVLEKMTGKWSVATKVYGHPAQPPMESTGKSEGKLLYDGRFVSLENEGTIMGMPSKGTILVGYDNYKKLYNFVMVGNMSTAVILASGTMDDAGKVLTFKGEMQDAMVGKRPVKHVIRFESDDKHVFESYDTLPDGKEFKVLESTFTRTK